jgi:hypothetical protein
VIVDSRWWNFCLIGRHEIEFERGHCFFVDPAWDITDIIPKHIERADELTLIVDTGFWKYGRLEVRFESRWEVDEIERTLRGMFRLAPSKSNRTGVT